MGGLWKMFLFLLVHILEGGGGENSHTSSTDATSATDRPAVSSISRQYTSPPRLYTSTPRVFTTTPKASTTTPPAYTCTPVDVKVDGSIKIELVGGKCHQGYVLLTINGEAGTICEKGFHHGEAEVVCRTLGLSGGESTHYGTSPRKKWLSDLDCFGDELSIMDCFANWDTPECSTEEVAAVSCIRSMPPAGGIKVELIGGDSKSGRVELIMYGERGTICNDNWDINDAVVICRMLGFTVARAYTGSNFGGGFGKIWLDEVQCDGTESNINECPLKFENHNCFFLGVASEVASVSCYDITSFELLGAVFSRMGRVSVNIDGVRTRVCAKYFTQSDADVACRELGYKFARRSHGSFGRESGSNSLNLRCGGQELSIADCASEMSFITCSHDSGVICSDEEFLQVSAVVQDGKAEINFKHKSLELCPAGWDDADASVFCKSMGYTHGMVSEGPEVFVETKHWLGDLGCSGNETHVSQCDQSGWVDSCYQNTSSYAKCIHSEERENLGLGLNIVFLLRNSIDMAPDSKTLQQCLMNKIIDGIDIFIGGFIENPYSTGLITYSSSANSDLFLGLCWNTSCTSDDLNDILKISNDLGNAVEKALDLATTHFSDHLGHRILAPNLCILFVTSPLDNVTQVMEAAQRLKDMGVVLIVVNVGNGVTSEHLEGLASHAKVYFSAEHGENTSEESIHLVANETAESVLKAQKYDSTCQTDQFPCDNGRCVSLAYVCDFSNDCGDNSDEAKCVVRPCDDGEYECDSGQCIPSTGVCDLYNDCYDRTDEQDCEGKCNQFSCSDDTCIPQNWVKDLITDCRDDETIDPVHPLIYPGQYNHLYTLYSNLSRIHQPNAYLSCTMYIDHFGKTFTMENCSEPVTCPIGFHRCPSSYCIPIDRICDGVMDCTDGEDEADCDVYVCPGY